MAVRAVPRRSRPKDDEDGVDGRGPAQVRAGRAGDGAPGHARPHGGHDRPDRPALQGRTSAALVDADHAPGPVAPGPRRLRLAAAGAHPAGAPRPPRPALRGAGGRRSGAGPGGPGPAPAAPGGGCRPACRRTRACGAASRAGGCGGGPTGARRPRPPAAGSPPAAGRRARWRLRAVLDRALAVLAACRRLAAGRRRRPTAAIIDTRSVKTGPQRGPRGYDAHKKVKGRKRVLMIDAQGDPLGVRVVPANVQDRDALHAPAPDLGGHHASLLLVWLDRGFAGDEPAAFLRDYGIVPELVGTPGRRSEERVSRNAESDLVC